MMYVISAVGGQCVRGYRRGGPELVWEDARPPGG